MPVLNWSPPPLSSGLTAGRIEASARTGLLINLRKQLINGFIALELAKRADCAISLPSCTAKLHLRMRPAVMVAAQPAHEFIPSADQLEHRTGRRCHANRARQPSKALSLSLKMQVQDHSGKAAYNRRTSREEAMAIKAEVDYQRLVSRCVRTCGRRTTSQLTERALFDQVALPVRVH